MAKPRRRTVDDVPNESIDPEVLRPARVINAAMLNACAVAVRACAVEIVMPRVWQALLDCAGKGSLEATVIVEDACSFIRGELDHVAMASAMIEQLRARGCAVQYTEVPKRSLSGYESLPKPAVKVSWRVIVS